MKKTCAIAWIVAILLSGCKEEPERVGNTLEIQPETTIVSQRYEPKLPTRIIEVDGNRITVEVADEQAERQKGLMFRSHIPDTIGMLFIFDEEKPHSFWMRNTSIPLAIAFIATDSTITDIKWMKPHDESHYFPSKPILYALETNRGWFVKRNIKPGAKVDF